MGAASFEEVLIGKDLRTAFNQAVAQAQYEYGHGGYTGTIAEKDGDGYVFMGQLPPRMTLRRLYDLLEDYDSWQYRVADYKSGYSQRKPGACPVPAQWLPLIEKAGRYYSDKWGPAIVFELTGSQKAEIKARRGRKGTQDKVWIAMGYASS
jgi:hypothetical protein